MTKLSTGRPPTLLGRMLALGILLLCGSPAGALGEVAALITPDGGTVASADGAVLFTFPAGAVAEDTTVTLSIVSSPPAPPIGGEWFGPVYALSPAETTLLAPVTATYTFGSTPFMPPDGKPPDVPHRFILVPWLGTSSPTPLGGSQTLFDESGGATFTVPLPTLGAVGLAVAGEVFSTPPDGKPPPPNATPPDGTPPDTYTPPNGKPPDLKALWNPADGGFVWTPPPGLCAAALWGFTFEGAGAATVTVATATEEATYEAWGEFTPGLVFPGAAGEGWIRSVTVAFPAGGAAVWAFAATPCA